MSLLPQDISLAETVQGDSIPMMAQVYVRLRHRIRELEQQIERLQVEQALDTSATTTELAVLEAQAGVLRAIEERSVVMGIGARVIVGSTAYVRTESDRPLTAYEIVLSTEANPAAGKVSFDSPLGSALLGREVGDTAIVETPRGQRSLQIMAIRHE